MNRLITRPRSLLLVAVLAVVAAMCTVPTAHAASSASVVPRGPAASSTQCNFVESLQTCESTDPTVSYTDNAYGNTSGCTFVFSITWGDGGATTETVTDPTDGPHLLATHTYAGPGVYTITVTVQVTAGNCTGTNSVHTFTLANAATPAAPSNLTATAVGPTSVRLTWTNNAADQSGVVISRNGVVSVNVQGATVSSYTWNGLSPDTKYWFYVASKIYGTPGDPTGSGNTQSAWVGPVYVTTPPNTSGSGWAGSSFCASFPKSQALEGNTPFDGMAACGGKWNGGTVQYQGVVFEIAPSGVNTWQCTELSARWFYIDTGLRPPLADDGRDAASDYGDKQFTVSTPTWKFDPSIHAGDIISMWGGTGTDPFGHVAVVTGVNVTGGTGTISVIEENGASSGNYYITVKKGKMSYDSPGSYYYYTTFQWVTLPAV
jgi:CHAP domain/Fibronectin type III domain